MKKIRRGQIIVMLMFLGLVGGIFGVWQFYLRDQLDIYAANARALDQLDRRLIELSDAFGGLKPEELLQRWRSETPAYRQALQERGEYFNFDEWYSFEPLPEGSIVRFEYQEAIDRLVREHWEFIAETNPAFGYHDPREWFAVPTLDQLVGQEITLDQANYWLGELAFGISAMETLAKYNAYDWQQFPLHVTAYPVRVRPERQNLLNERTVSYQFTMSLDDLRDFITDLREGDRYASIDGLRIEQPYIAATQRPLLRVQMLLTQAGFNPPADPSAAPAVAVAAAAGAPPGAIVPPVATTGNPAMDLAALQNRRPRAPVEEEPSTLRKFYRWFMRTILSTNVR